MDTRRTRTVISQASVPSLASHVRLQFDPVRGAWAVLSPERILWPNEVGLDILRMLDGRRSVEAISTALAGEYDAEADEVAADVAAFLQEWSDRLLVIA
jgi:pyrroloquinoline quinone biosynthesis protein D